MNRGYLLWKMCKIIYCENVIIMHLPVVLDYYKYTL